MKRGFSDPWQALCTQWGRRNNKLSGEIINCPLSQHSSYCGVNVIVPFKSSSAAKWAQSIIVEYVSRCAVVSLQDFL